MTDALMASADVEREFFGKLKRILSAGGSVMVIDSVWNDTLRGERVRRGAQKRTLNDGRTFSIYKRYFEMTDIEKMFKQYRIELEGHYLGKAFSRPGEESKVSMSDLEGYLHAHTVLKIGLPLGPYGKSSRQQWNPKDLLQPIAAFAKTAIVDPRTGSAKIPPLRHLPSSRLSDRLSV